MKSTKTLIPNIIQKRVCSGFFIVALSAFTNYAQASNSSGDSDVVLWMLDHVPHIVIREGENIRHEGINLYPNPGQWTQFEFQQTISVNSWAGIGLDGFGATVWPSHRGTVYFQRFVQYHSIAMVHDRDYYAFFPNYDQRQTIANIANGLVIGDTDRHGPMNVEGYAIKGDNDQWIYRYLFSNTGSSSSTFEFMLSEADTHYPHDETMFLNANGNYNYDGPPLSGLLDHHNYDWTHLSLLPGESLMVGFTDIHGPTLENWGIRQEDGSVLMGIGRLPVPASVPEPDSLAFMLAGLVAAQLARLKISRR